VSKALTRREAGIAAIRQVDRKAIRKAVNLVERGMLDASRINDDGRDDQGEDPFKGLPDAERRRRIAKDLRLSKRYSPVYIDVALKRIEGAERIDSITDQAAPVSLNIGTVNVVVPRQYETVDVTAKKVGE
jgi:hypothetical protein